MSGASPQNGLFSTNLNSWCDEDNPMKTIHGKAVCETLVEVLNPAWTAVLAIDIQNDAFRPNGKLAQAGNDIEPMLRILPKCAEFIHEARRNHVPVIHARIVDLPDGQSDSPSWIRAKLKMSNVDEFFVEGTWGAEICDECAPVAGEIVITKHRSSAFVGTSLDSALRSNGIQTVVIIGEQTPGCVEATFRDAAYHDYYAVLVADCVAAFDPELHEASLKIQRARHDVCDANDVASAWRAHAANVGAEPTGSATRQ